MRLQRLRIKLLLLDAHNTLFTPSGNRSWQQLVAHVVQAETGHVVDPERLSRATAVVRAETLRASRAAPNSSEWWAEVNRRVLAQCGHPITPQQGRQIHERLVAGDDLYTASAARRAFVQRLAKKFGGSGVVRAIATNGPDGAIDRLLSANDMQRLVMRVYGSTTLNGLLKPSPDYFREILHRLSILPQDTLLVGNSLRNDLPAARMGIHVCVIPRRTERFSLRDVCVMERPPRTLIHATPVLSNAWAWIDRHFVAAT